MLCYLWGDGMNSSFIVTGASASGKSTLINFAIRQGYVYLPTHMTRKPRIGEENGKDAVFLTNDEFINNFINGFYLEESLEFALLKSLNIYYGTPKERLNYLSFENYCATPVSIEIANKIKERTNLIWLHLYCEEIDRYNRLIARGISEEEIKNRMISGDSINFPKKADLFFNTSFERPTEILKKVRRI